MNSTRPSLLDIAPAHGAFYVESSIPAGLTLSEFRRSRPRRGRWHRLKELAGYGAGGGAVAAAGT
jgi:hypothetical protein